MSEEKKGELYTFLGGVFWAFFPIITILALKGVPSMTTLAWSTGFSCLFFLVLFLYKKQYKELQKKKVWLYSLFVALLTGVCFYGLFFWGLTMTTAGNAGLVALFETFTSFVFFSILRREHFKTEYKVGAVLMVLGAGCVLFRNFSGINQGDLLIVAATFFAPAGNMFQQKLKKITKTETILFLRTLISTPIIFLLAILLGQYVTVSEVRHVIPFLLINGILIVGLSKVFWIEAIHRISVTKAIALGAFIPFLTLILSWIIFNQAPTWPQIVSLPFLIAGTYLLTDNWKFKK
jgi:drug/metabolite transporter (DMT)-like permease